MVLQRKKNPWSSLPNQRLIGKRWREKKKKKWKKKWVTFWLPWGEKGRGGPAPRELPGGCFLFDLNDRHKKGGDHKKGGMGVVGVTGKKKGKERARGIDLHSVFLKEVYRLSRKKGKRKMDRFWYPALSS